MVKITPIYGWAVFEKAVSSLIADRQTDISKIIKRVTCAQEHPAEMGDDLDRDFRIYLGSVRGKGR